MGESPREPHEAAEMRRVHLKIPPEWEPELRRIAEEMGYSDVLSDFIRREILWPWLKARTNRQLPPPPLNVIGRPRKPDKKPEKR